ncbi:MAG: MBL fold metallo-hydrolase [Alphaproteobacteria bacterium]|nr:MBL fold metallo-hydrolase [Alphaproteobacteria bacterium]MCA0448970.1 MBL fold metallo-hydrolase [Pseudomonadota bacterium]
MKLTFLGSGDAFGSGGRFNTCFLLESGAKRILIDCGASSMIAIRKFGVDPATIDAVLVTHLHGDHFGGLPFFLLDAQLITRRARPLKLFGPPGFEKRLLAACENFFPGSTQAKRPYEFSIAELSPETPHDVAGFTATPFEVVHWSGGPPYAYRIEADGKTFCYSGDTEWVDTLVPAAKNADLFVCEAYFFDKKVKYHLDWRTLEARLVEIGAKRTILTHMSAELLARLGETACETADDGKVVEF